MADYCHFLVLTCMPGINTGSPSSWKQTDYFPALYKTGPPAVKYAQLKGIKISLVSSLSSSLHVPVWLLHLEMEFWEHQYFTDPNGPVTFIPDILKRKIELSHHRFCLRKLPLETCLSIRHNQTELIFLSRWERQHTLLEAGILKPYW